MLSRWRTASVPALAPGAAARESVIAAVWARGRPRMPIPGPRRLRSAGGFRRTDPEQPWRHDRPTIANTDSRDISVYADSLAGSPRRCGQLPRPRCGGLHRRGRQGQPGHADRGSRSAV